MGVPLERVEGEVYPRPVGGGWYALEQSGVDLEADHALASEVHDRLVGLRIERHGLRAHRTLLPLLDLQPFNSHQRHGLCLAPEQAQNAPPQVHRPLLPHQAVDAAWLRSRASGYHAGATGVGKTATALAAVLDHRPILVAGPLAALDSWRREAKALDPKIRIATVVGRWALDRPLPTEPDLWLIHYDILNSWAAAFTGRKPASVVFDEAHRLRSPGAARTRAAWRVAATVPYRYALSATPIVRSVADLHPVFHAIAPGAFGRYWDFARRYTEVVESPYGPAVGDRPRADTAKELQLRLAEIIKHRSLDEVAPYLPPVTLDRYLVEPPPGYAKLERAVRSELTGGNDASAVIAIGQLLRATGKAKLEPAVDQALAALRSGAGPVIVWSWHRDIARQVAFTVANHGFRSHLVTGEDPASARRRTVEEFQAGLIDVLAATMDSIGESETLTRARLAIFAELWWLSATLIQTMGRCRRIGLDHPVRILFLVAAGTIDEDIVRRVIDRSESMDVLHSGAATDLRELLSQSGPEDLEAISRDIDRKRSPWWILTHDGDSGQ